MTCLSDDSGLEIDILEGDPGIYSARWGGKKGDFVKAMNRIFMELDKKDKNWRNKKVKARFICALTIYGNNKKLVNATGKVDGYISSFLKGNNGFGYDPIFIPRGKKITFGEMEPLQKYKIDHRFKAFKKIKKFF
jgi:XTP/dITP diphosphohydrolase